MKTVFLEMEKLKDLNSGLGQFCFHLGKSLSQLPDLQFIPNFYAPSSNIPAFGEGFNYIPANKLYRFFRIQKSFDLWHCLHQGSPYLPAKKSTKVILTIHDLNFLEEKKSLLKKKVRLKKIQSLINRANAITVISQYTEQVIRRNLVIPNIPLQVIYNGNSLKTFSNVPKPDFLPEGKFFFSIGIISRKKNFISLIPLLKHFKDFTLVLAGNKKHACVKEIVSMAQELGVADRVIMPGIVDDEAKFWLYKNCTAFLFPSIAEGFGLPVIEAMSLGKPVFISQATSLPEIGGKEAFYFNNFKPADMIEVVEQGLKKFSSDKEKSKRTMDWAEQFSWHQSAKAYQELYLKLLA